MYALINMGLTTICIHYPLFFRKETHTDHHMRYLSYALDLKGRSISDTRPWLTLREDASNGPYNDKDGLYDVGTASSRGNVVDRYHLKHRE